MLNLSPAVSNIYFVHHSEARFGDVIKTGELILSDLGTILKIGISQECLDSNKAS